MEKCPLCCKIHGEIYEKFSQYTLSENHTEEDCKNFINSIVSELTEKNWSAVSCLLQTIIRQEKFRPRYNVNSNLFFLTCISLEETIRNPNIHSISKIENLINNLNNYKLLFYKIKKNIPTEELNNHFKAIRDLARSLDNNIIIIPKNIPNSIGAQQTEIICEKCRKKIDTSNAESFKIPEKTCMECYIKENQKSLDKFTDEHLRNYIFLRVNTFYERLIYYHLNQTINNLPKNNLYDLFPKEVTLNSSTLEEIDEFTLGNIRLINYDKSPAKLNEIIKQILRTKYGINKNNEDFKNFNFLNFVDKIIKFNPKLQSYLSSGWFGLIKKFNEERNKIIHDLGKYDLDIPIIHVVALYQTFSTLFPKWLNFILDLSIKQKEPELKKSYDEYKKDLMGVNGKSKILWVEDFDNFKKLFLELKIDNNHNKGKSYDNKMYPCTCSDCGKATQVPFEPIPGRAVYCKECREKHPNPKFRKRY